MDFVKEISTNWSIINYFKIPENMRFMVTNEVSFYKLDENNHLTTVRQQYAQKATYVSLTKRKSDKSLFNIQILDEDFTTIRGKVAHKNNATVAYKKVYDMALCFVTESGWV